jgi:hypothetical protein
VERSHRIVLTLPQRLAGFDITLSHRKVEEKAHRAADLSGLSAEFEDRQIDAE